MEAVACVALVCASGLVAWRWWLAHRLEMSKVRVAQEKSDADLLPGRLRALEDRVRDMEWRASKK